MVAGQPVAVQSPARNIFGIGDFCCGRQRSIPGSGENVAAVSLMTVAFTNWAARDLGSTCRTSCRTRSIISCRDLGIRSYEALITICRYCSFDLGSLLATGGFF